MFSQVFVHRGGGLHGGGTPLSRYSQPAVSTHPTGMHYCFKCPMLKPSFYAIYIDLQF